MTSVPSTAVTSRYRELASAPETRYRAMYTMSPGWVMEVNLEYMMGSVLEEGARDEIQAGELGHRVEGY